MLLDAAETAMVIRKYQSVFRHDHPRTETAVKRVRKVDAPATAADGKGE
jgi:hypothetical protein